MGYDISFHPIAWDVLNETVYPYIVGETSERALDALVADAVRIGRVRFRANAWGLGVSKLRDTAPSRFESHLHIWGRPFFVTAEGTEAIASTVDAYLAATPDQVDAIAKEQLELLEPGLSARVTPDESGRLPSDADAAKGVRSHTDLMRRCVMAVRAGQRSIDFGGQTHEPGSLLGRELALTALTLSADLRPGWMGRGPLWPTLLLREGGVDPGGRVIANAAMFMPGMDALPDVDWFLAETILENHMVGGAVSPKHLGSLRDDLRSIKDATVARYEGDPGVALTFQKIDEAMADAEHRNVPFCEATEVYSGFSGIMN